jgi:hypothetical protein
VLEGEMEVPADLAVPGETADKGVVDEVRVERT